MATGNEKWPKKNRTHRAKKEVKVDKKPEVKKQEKKVKSPEKKVVKRVHERSKPVKHAESPKPKKEESKVKILDSYLLKESNVEVGVSVKQDPKEFVLTYDLASPIFAPATKALLNDLRSELVATTHIPSGKVLDSKFFDILREKFKERAETLLRKELPNVSDEDLNLMVLTLLHDMLGLGNLEYLLDDGNLEDIVINSSKEPMWAYHKKFGWLKTNVMVPDEKAIQNYASII
ncbi:MAG: hypothetical protein GOV15_04300, partial [Candidatus Diapherotrites archaeon]|nr:hypothetical protein [Candidatus Diapherotrites archaeon]